MWTYESQLDNKYHFNNKYCFYNSRTRLPVTCTGIRKLLLLYFITDSLCIQVRASFSFGHSSLHSFFFTEESQYVAVLLSLCINYNFVQVVFFRFLKKMTLS